jgi:uncharacterized phage protein (TIGR01671 family)
MARDIKFRIWNPGTKSIDYVGMIIPDWVNYTVDTVPFPSIMQYTGLKDVKGKEIYEGDIVQGTSTQHETGWANIPLYFLAIVTFKDGAFKFEMGNAEFLSILENKVEVVGNIFENPEFMCHTENKGGT